MSQLYGEQRTQSHPEFCAACSRQRARITTAGDALASIGQPRTKLSAIIDASLSLIRRETSVLSGGEASAVVSMRPDKKINFTLSQPAALRFGLQKYPAGAPVWGRRPVRWPCGQPAGRVGVQNAIARPRCWLKGCPTGCWPQSLEWSSSQWCSLVGAAAASTTIDPHCQYIDAVKTHRWRSRRAKAAGDDVRHTHAVGPSQQAPLLRWLEARPLRCGQASNGAEDRAGLMACQLAVCKTLA